MDVPEDTEDVGGITLGELNGMAIGASERVRLSITVWAIRRILQGLAEKRSFEAIISEDLAFGHLPGIDPRRVLVAAGALELMPALTKKS